MDIQELKSGIDNLTDANTRFKKTYDEKFEKLHETVKNLDKEMLEIVKKATRPHFTGSGTDDMEWKTQLSSFIRSRGEEKGMWSSSGPDGGWTTTSFLDQVIHGIERNDSALRQLINFTELAAGDAYEEMISVTPAGAAWVGEISARPETTSPTLIKVRTELQELYAAPTLTQRLADDSGSAMVDFLVNEVAISFAEAEELALISGVGVVSPLGLNSVPTSTAGDATRPWGTIQYTPSGAAGAFVAAPDGLDAVMNLLFSLHAGYRKNAKWLMNSQTALALSKLRDGDNNYVWNQGDVKVGAPSTLLGKEVVISEAVSNITANSLSIWLADWNQAFRAISRNGNKVLLDPYTNKPHIVCYVYRRMGLQLRNSAAIKVMKFSTT